MATGAISLVIHTLFWSGMMSRSLQTGTVAAAHAVSATAKASSGVVVKDISLECVDGIKLAAQSWEKRDTPSSLLCPTRILCLHGWMDNCRSFARLAPHLVQNLNNTQVVALDFPGHGWSAHKSLDGTPAVQAELVFYVAEAARQLKWWEDDQSFVVIGHSMGAAVASLFSAAFHDRVSSLVLLEGAGPLTRDPTDVAKHVREHVLRRQNGPPKEPRVYPSLDKAVEVRCWTAQNFPGNQWLSKEAAKEMVIRGSRQLPGDGIQFRHDPRLQWPSLLYFSKAQVQGMFQSISCPSALILADEGWPISEEDIQESMKLLKPSTYVKLPGSHHFHADPETSDQVATHVVDFLQQQQAKQPLPSFPPQQRSKH